MFRWSNEEDMDKGDTNTNTETLPQMYSIVYKKILEIQFKLSEFVRSIKFGLDYNQIMMSGRDNKLLEFGLATLIDLYRRVNMGSEIQQVVNSLINLNKEVKGLKLLGAGFLHGSLDEHIEELIKELEAGENFIKEGLEGLQTDERLNPEKTGLSKERKIQLLEMMPASFRLSLPGIGFPAHTHEIIQYAEKANIEKVVNDLKKLPNKTYDNADDLERILPKIFADNDGKKEVMKIDKETGDILRVRRLIGRIRIDTRDIRNDKQLLEERLLKQEQELGGQLT